ncbi:hypothetical protein WJX74_004636 [Apatococcus lobatus]|uniref:Uncharacterized protein n=1 Tax=Apatococcus lobatus TaxID=904363 RepID=A0AAW1QLS8_9CHLO
MDSKSEAIQQRALHFEGGRCGGVLQQTGGRVLQQGSAEADEDGLSRHQEGPGGPLQGQRPRSAFQSAASTRICPCTLLSVPNHQLLRVACMAPTMLRRLEPCGQNDLQQETACRVLQVCQPTFRGERYSMGS